MNALPEIGIMESEATFIRLRDEEIREAFAPAVRRSYRPNDPQWRSLVRRDRLHIARRAVKSRFRWILPKPKLNYKYENKWSVEEAAGSQSYLTRTGFMMSWRDQRFVASYLGMKRVHLLYIARIIEALRPARVLEVGAGTGSNLIVLSRIFPEVGFTGIELSKAGVDTAKSLAAMDELPQVLCDLSPLPPCSADAHRRIDFRQASVSDLPFADSSFDLVYSIQALEQVELVRHEALHEISRVTTDAVVHCEPWHEFNASGWRRQRVLGSGYWQGRIADLPKYGLHPVFATGDIPTKTHYSVGVVLARKSP